MRSSVRATALVVALVAGGAVGCNSNVGAQQAPAMTPAAAVAKAAKTADAITSVHYRMNTTMPGAGKMTGEAEMSLKPLAMDMKMTPEGPGAHGPMEIRLVDKAMYIGGNAAMSKEMGGKSWFKLDLSASGPGKALIDQFGAGQTDENPAAQSTFLTGSKNVKKVGTETVDGEKTTHYQGTVTLDQIRASFKTLGKGLSAAREKSLEGLQKIGVTKMTMDMWVDGDNHPKQFHMKADTPKGPLDSTVTFLDVNKPVTVTAPPAKDTASLADMMKSAAGN